MWAEVQRDLLDLCPAVSRNVRLSALSRWEIGGRAALFAEPCDKTEVASVVRYARNKEIPLVVIGHGSNLLFDDCGVEAIVLRIGRRMARIERDRQTVSCGAGVWVPRLARYVAAQGLEGLQHTIGIPGTLGGLIHMNGGSQRKGIGDNIVSVCCVGRDGTCYRVSRDECEFGYRKSMFQRCQTIITDCVLSFSRGDRGDMRREMLSILKSRRLRFPLRMPNCGSVFVSDPGLYATVGSPGSAIEFAGLKGVQVGGLKISEQHANFFVNTGSASSRDALDLIRLAREKVYTRTGVYLDCEVRYVSTNGRVRPAHLEV